MAGTINNAPAFAQFPAAGEVVARRVVRPEITRTISLAWPGRRNLSVAAQAVYDVVRQCAMEAVKEGRWQGVPLC